MKGLVILKLVLVSLLGLTALGSCISERPVSGDPVADGTTVTFKVKVPGATDAGTRALSDANEYKVETIDLLVFDATGFLYSTHGVITSAPTAAGGGGATMTFDAMMLEHDELVNIMVLANSRYVIKDFYPAGIPVGTTEDAVQQILTIDKPLNWDIFDPFIPFPMWGYMENQTMDIGHIATVHEVSLIRMVAKIDIQLADKLVDKTDVTKSTFQLTDVHMFNYAITGMVIPSIDGFDWAGADNTGFAGYNTPSLPTGDFMMYDDNSYSWNVGYDSASDLYYNKLKNSIYLFEAAAATDATYTQGPCVVIEGNYNGSAQSSFYRIDFVQKNSSTGAREYLPVLRNNYYNITVLDITGPGYATASEAYNSEPTNIDAAIIQWTNPDFTTLVTDGTNVLGLSQPDFLLGPTVYDDTTDGNRLKITTNVATGWTAVISSSETEIVAPSDVWMSVSQSSGSGNYNSGDEIYFLVQSMPEGVDSRTMYVHVTAGDLKYVVEVTQRGPFISITRGGVDMGGQLITFDSNPSTLGTAPAPQTLLIEWGPADRPLQVSKTQLAGTDANFTFGADDVITLPAGGRYELTVDPAGFTAEQIALNPFYSMGSEVTYTIDGMTISESTDMSMTHWNVVVTGVQDGSGQMTVKSNVDWSLGISDPNNLFDAGSFPTSGSANEGGNVYSYTLNELQWDQGWGQAYLVFLSTPDTSKLGTLTIRIVRSIANQFALSNVVMIDVGALLGLLGNDYILTFAEVPNDVIGKPLIKGGEPIPGLLPVQQARPIPVNMQGMLFRWGSLLGMNVADVSLLGDLVEITLGDAVEFIPEEFPAERIPTGSTPLDIFDTETYWVMDDTGMDTPFQIPMIDDAPIPSVLDGDSIVAMYPGTGYDVANGVGDICRYISDKGWVEERWRLPTEHEMRILLSELMRPNEVGGYPIGLFEGIANVTLLEGGFNPLLSGVIAGWGMDGWNGVVGDLLNLVLNLQLPDTIFLPSSGYIESGSSPSLADVDIFTSYLTSTSDSGGGAGNVRLDNQSLGISLSWSASASTVSYRAYPVRCIRDWGTPAQ